MTRPLDRRSLLSLGSVVLALPLAGCTDSRLVEAEREPPPLEGAESEGVDLPVEGRYDVAASAIELADGASIEDLSALESYLRDQGLAVESLEESSDAGPIVSLESPFEPGADEGVMWHMGVVAGGYAALVEAGHDAESLEATLLDGDGRGYGHYEIWRDWAEEYAAGERTAREYAGEVAVTFETD